MKAAVSIYRRGEEKPIERYKARISVTEDSTKQGIDNFIKHLAHFLGLKEKASKLGLGSTDNKVESQLFYTSCVLLPCFSDYYASQYRLIYDLIASRKYSKRGGNYHERMGRTLQTSKAENRSKTKQALFHQLCTSRQKLEHGASFLFQIAARNVQPLQFLMNQYPCLRHLPVRLSLLSVTKKFPKSSSAPSLNLSRWMNLKVTLTMTIVP